MIELFYNFVHERWAIRERRIAGQPWPWTDDPILREYKFTNVKREHDRTSRILIDEFYSKHKISPFEEVLLNSAIFRYFGTVEAARAFGWSSFSRASLERVEDIAAQRLAKRERLYTGAYLVTSGGRKGPKHQTICRGYLVDLIDKATLVRDATLERETMEDAVIALCRIDGFALFMAKEVLIDTRYTGCWQPTDLETWTAVGPGAARGAAYIKYGELGHTISRPNALDVCREVHVAQDQYDGLPHLTLEDVQFQMCEFFKYVKTAAGAGRPRSRYRKPI